MVEMRPSRRDRSDELHCISDHPCVNGINIITMFLVTLGGVVPRQKESIGSLDLGHTCWRVSMTKAAYDGDVKRRRKGKKAQRNAAR